MSTSIYIRVHPSEWNSGDLLSYFFRYGKVHSYTKVGSQYIINYRRLEEAERAVREDKLCQIEICTTFIIPDEAITAVEGDVGIDLTLIE